MGQIVGIGDFADDDLRQTGVPGRTVRVNGLAHLPRRECLLRDGAAQILLGVPYVVKVAHGAYLPTVLPHTRILPRGWRVSAGGSAPEGPAS